MKKPQDLLGTAVGDVEWTALIGRTRLQEYRNHSISQNDADAIRLVNRTPHLADTVKSTLI